MYLLYIRATDQLYQGIWYADIRHEVKATKIQIAAQKPLRGTNF